jgi:hypothetical protein
MNANYLEVSGRTYYAFEEPEFVGPPVQMTADRARRRTVILDGTVPSFLEQESGFWRRQFGGDGPATRWQEREYDWYFGFFLPVLCIYFDPFVFRTWWTQPGVLHDFQLFVYILSSISILGMVAWLFWGQRLRWLNGWLAGVFLAAGIVSGLVGIILFPISLVGSLALVGALGFTPLLASVVFLRNGVRAMRSAAPFLEKQTLVNVVTLSGLISLVVPWVINQIWRQPTLLGIDFLR